jgi:hypothetical protein
MTNALRKAYAALGLEPDASAGMLREQYLLLVKRWHPDRHSTDPVNQANATERMREINEAYQLIVEVQGAEGAAAASADPPSPEPELRSNAGWDSSRNKQVIDSILRNRRPGFSFRLSTGRTFSLAVSALYVLWTVSLGEPGALAIVVGLLLLPLACIWLLVALLQEGSLMRPQALPWPLQGGAFSFSLCFLPSSGC